MALEKIREAKIQASLKDRLGMSGQVHFIHGKYTNWSKKCSNPLHLDSTLVSPLLSLREAFTDKTIIKRYKS